MSEVWKVEPSERVRNAIEFAKGEILKQLGKDTPEHRKMMQVALLPPSGYELAIRDKSTGSMFPGLSRVFVKQSEVTTDYGTTSVAFHELVHKWGEIQQHVFHEKIDPDDPNKKITVIENRRQGMRIRKLVRDRITGEILDAGFIGGLLNELGNYAWQKVFIHQLFTDPQMKPQFQDEFDFRQKKLKETFGESGADTATVSVIMQLADELAAAVGDIDGLTLLQTLIRLKTHPEEQGRLRTAIDQTFGDGFYKGIRETPVEESLDPVVKLLVEVQDTLAKMRATQES